MEEKENLQNQTVSEDVTSQEEKPIQDSTDWKTEAEKAKQELQKLQEQIQKFEDKDANFKKFRDQQKKELEETKKTLEEKLFDAKLSIEWTQALGTKPSPEILQLIDKSKIQVSEDGSITGMTEEIERIKGIFQPLLKNQAPQNVGVNADSSSSMFFTREQIADRDFWTKNKPEILKAQKEGRIK